MLIINKEIIVDIVLFELIREAIFVYELITIIFTNILLLKIVYHFTTR